MITVLFFASLSETLQCKKIELAHTSRAMSVTDLIMVLSEKGKHWQQALTQSNIIVAINQSVANHTTVICDNDEVAFYPPVSGG